MLKMNNLPKSRLGDLCHNISSKTTCATSLWTTLFSTFIFLAAFAIIPSRAMELCGGIRGRFVCDDQDPAVFHICMGNNQYTMVCPGTLHFNVRTQTCDWPKSVNCVREAQIYASANPSPPTKVTSSPARTYPTMALPTKAPRSSVLETSTVDQKWRASEAPPQATSKPDVPHRFRLKVVHNSEEKKPLESLVPKDDEVIEQIQSLSEELKHIDNFLKESDSDSVGYLVEPYRSSYSARKLPYMRRHRQPKSEAQPSPFRALSSPAASPYRTTSPYRFTSPLSPYRNVRGPYSDTQYHKKIPPPRVETFWPRPQRQTSISQEKPTEPKWYETSAAKTSDFTNSKKSQYSAAASNSVHDKSDTYPSQRKSGKTYGGDTNNGQWVKKEISKSSNDFVDRTSVNTNQHVTKTTSSWWTERSDKVYDTHRHQTGGSIFSPPPHHSSTNQRTTTLRRYRPTTKRTYGVDRSHDSFTTVTKPEDSANDKNSKFQHRDDATPQPPKQDTHVTQPVTSRFHGSPWTIQNARSQKSSDTSPWWSTTRTSPRPTPAPSADKDNSESDSNSPFSLRRLGKRPLYRSTATRQPTYARSPKISEKPDNAPVHSTAAGTSSWWSTTRTDQKTTLSPRTRPKYKPRRYRAKPNYYTRTPSDDFALVPPDERSSSYMSLMKQDTSINAPAAGKGSEDTPINAPAAGRRKSFSLHSSYVKAHNQRVNGASERNFNLHGSINAPAAADRSFALSKTYDSAQSKIDAAKAIDKTFALHRAEDKSDDKEEISAFKSPVTKYKTKPGKCSSKWCKLPDCRCIGSDIPGGFDAKEIPQIVMLTFDDSINFQNMKYYKDIFNGSLKNPNGCPIKSTFFVSGDNSDYQMVRRMYKQGHEIASHTLSHRNPTTWWAHAGYENWENEVVGMRKRMNEKSNVPIDEITGMRAPFLQVGGDAQYAMLKENKFRYDSSMVTGNLYTNNRPPIWPFTLDTPPDSTTCSLTPCPTRSYPGLWEVPLVRWYGSNDMACAMPDACTTELGAEGSRKFVEQNFMRHYTTNRAPLGIFIHASWFDRKAGNLEGLLQFLASLKDKEDVWVITVSQALDWIQRPVRLSALRAMESWTC